MAAADDVGDGEAEDIARCDANTNAGPPASASMVHAAPRVVM
jgi:hypothetical protein